MSHLRMPKKKHDYYLALFVHTRRNTNVKLTYTVFVIFFQSMRELYLNFDGLYPFHLKLRKKAVLFY